MELTPVKGFEINKSFENVKMPTGAGIPNLCGRSD
jgi:hypothetical protein